MKLNKNQKRIRRARRQRRKFAGTAQRPRLAVYRSLRFIYAQLIDDERGVTLLAVTDHKTKVSGDKKERAKATGKRLAKEALAKGIKAVVFDRAGRRFTGRLKHFAEGARTGGLKF